MRIVAVAALDLALDDRVMRRLERLGADVLVAGAADLRLVRQESRRELVDGDLLRHQVHAVIRRQDLLAVDAVAVAARDLVYRVLAGGPESKIAAGAVAVEANGGL